MLLGVRPFDMDEQKWQCQWKGCLVLHIHWKSCHLFVIASKKCRHSDNCIEWEKTLMMQVTPRMPFAGESPRCICNTYGCRKRDACGVQVILLFRKNTLYIFAKLPITPSERKTYELPQRRNSTHSTGLFSSALPTKREKKTLLR